MIGSLELALSATLPIQRLFLFSCGQMVAWVHGRVKPLLQRGKYIFTNLQKGFYAAFMKL